MVNGEWFMVLNGSFRHFYQLLCCTCDQLVTCRGHLYVSLDVQQSPVPWIKAMVRLTNSEVGELPMATQPLRMRHVGMHVGSRRHQQQWDGTIQSELIQSELIDFWIHQ